jgi:acetyl/propionyl-CoA carboxylase alpha subunit
MNLSFWLDQKEFRLSLEQREGDIIQVSLGEKKFNVLAELISPHEILLNIDGKVFNIVINSDALSYSIFVNGRFYKIEKKSALKILREVRGKLKKKDIKTTMPGRIVKVFMREGDRVEEGQAVLVLEAMKMQNEIKSPQSGVLLSLNFSEGDYAEAGAILFSVE